MTKAYVLLTVQSGAEGEVLEKLKKVEQLTEIYSTNGVYDFLVKVEADTLEKVKETVDLHLRKLDKVKSSITMIVFEK